jgi:hypothetical protein
MATDIKTQPSTASYNSLRECTAGPMLACEVRPLTAACAAPLVAALPKIDATEAREWQLTVDLLRAEAKALEIDGRLDRSADAVIQALRFVTKGDLKDPRYVHFMGSMEPNELKDPVLEEELDTLEAWVPDLLASPHPELSVLGAPLDAQVKEARIVEAELTKARQALASFREIGEKPALVAEINAARKITHGDLAAIVHQNPLADLPKDLADRAFRGDARTRRLTTKQLRAKLATAQRTVVDLEAMVTASEAADTAREAKKTKRANAKKQKKIDKAEQRAARAAAKVAELKGG